MKHKKSDFSIITMSTFLLVKVILRIAKKACLQEGEVLVV